jgi:sulfide dehydrogenase cytochrome subunit
MESLIMNIHGNKYLVSLCSGLLLIASGAQSALAADAEELFEPCTVCHGKEGASTNPDMPIIGGMSAPYLNDAMIAYQEKDWPCHEVEIPDGPDKGKKTDMCTIAGDLSEKEIGIIGEYLAAKPFVRASQEFDADQATKGEQVHDANCKKCHDEGGSLASDDSGILAGQWMPYIRQSFKDFSSGDRPMTKKMKPKYEKLEEADREALIHYYASFK